MKHSKDCTAGISDIDPTCEACIQQRLDRSRGYIDPKRVSVSDDEFMVTGVDRPQARAAGGVTPLGQCLVEQEWDDYADDMNKLPPWNEGI